jgi:hypothetical protein
MMATESNIGFGDHYFTGEDKLVSFAITNSAGAVQDITGWALSWMVKADPLDDDEDALVTKVSGDGVAITNGPAGLGAVTVEDDDIAALAGDTRYYHELKRTDAGLETVLIYGTFRLSQAVHR